MSQTRILFVEDEDDLRFLIFDALTDLGYDVTMAGNGREAMGKLRDGTAFDHVVTDVSMPHGVSGLEVAEEAARLHPGAGIVLVSGYQRSQLPPLPDGARFLPKPYRLHQLLGVIESVG